MTKRKRFRAVLMSYHLSMNGKSILVIGGSGFLGSNFIDKALQKNFYIENISLSKKYNIENPKLKNYTCNILDKTKLSKIISNKNFNYVINFGNYVDHSNFANNGNVILDTQIKGLMNLVDLIKDDTLEKFINIGSSDEYGSNESPQKEDMISQPFSPYSLGKVFCSEFLRMKYKTENFPAITIRPFLVYGPNQKKDRFVPFIIDSCLKDIDFPCTEGKQVRDFCFVDDFSDAIFCIFNSPGVSGEILNIASGKAVSIKDITKKISNLIGGGNPRFGELKMRESENMKLYADISKAKKLLKWNPKTSLNKGLLKTIDFYKK